MEGLIQFIIVIVAILVVLSWFIKIAYQYERLVLYTLGKYQGLRPRLLHSQSNLSQPMQSATDIGLLSHHDLANRGSVAHLLTADVGRSHGPGFQLLGRAPAADLRGCGLVQENLLEESGL